VLTASTTAQMVKCGANIIGFDQLQPFDGRLEAMVWSWAKDQPSAAGGDCAEQGEDARFRVANCHRQLPFACVDSSLDWHVTRDKGRWEAGLATCAREYPGSTFGVPPNGYRNAQLAAASGGRSVWLNYSRSGSTWVAH
jgi:hypothetical protein